MGKKWKRYGPLSQLLAIQIFSGFTLVSLFPPHHILLGATNFVVRPPGAIHDPAITRHGASVFKQTQSPTTTQSSARARAAAPKAVYRRRTRAAPSPCAGRGRPGQPLRRRQRCAWPGRAPAQPA
ncbi:hypothetical protein IWZ03DRAFT_121787 [Phyllosticta citriasiana]|uniref:Uncharacterized protein n=1 Tax=Phyllosticta citriasiana TaxID=595635 RepID=A0ABR1K7E4_9PEZI